MQSKELYDDILRQTDVACLLESAESALSLATEAALDATRAKLSPLGESADDTRLMNRMQAVLREVHALRVERIWALHALREERSDA